MMNEAIIEALGARTITIRIPAPVLRGIGYTVNGIMSTLGKEVHLNQDKMREVTARNWLIDISNAQKYLDYNPSYGLRDGILETLGKRES